MSRVAVQQPNYFPWIGYFHKIAAVDAFVFLDNVEFQRGNASSVTNRTTIRTAQGPQRITVPTLRSGDSSLLMDTRIDQSQAWKRRHLGSLKAAYGRAPGFAAAFAPIAEIIERAGDSLADLNRESVETLCRLLKIETPLHLASELNLSATDKNERLVEICLRLGATTYLSGRGAKRYNNEDLFRSNGIALEYSAFVCPSYPQIHGPFVPNLSMLDALFSCGPDARLLLTA